MHIPIELNNRIKILAGVVVLAAAGAGAWLFYFQEDAPPPKPAASKAPAKPAAKAAPDAPKKVDAAKSAVDESKQAPVAKPVADPAPAPEVKPAAKVEEAKPVATTVAKPVAKPAESPPAVAATPVAVEVPGYQRPPNIRELYTRYNDLVSATVMRDRAAVKELLDDGKNPNARQRDGFTPLMIAASNGDTEIAAMLLAKGADPNPRAGGKSALSIAKSRGSAGAGVVQLLERSGARD